MRMLNHLALAAADPRRTARLFELAFGATVKAPPAGEPDASEVTIDLHGLDLVLVRSNGPASIGAAHVALNVTRAQAGAIRKVLEAQGLPVEEPRRGPPGRALYFADYDNNLFELCIRESHEA